jgi:hypothetical protein
LWIKQCITRTKPSKGHQLATGQSFAFRNSKGGVMGDKQGVDLIGVLLPGNVNLTATTSVATGRLVGVALPSSIFGQSITIATGTAPPPNPGLYHPATIAPTAKAVEVAGLVKVKAKRQKPHPERSAIELGALPGKCHIDEMEVETLFGFARRTLQMWRLHGEGPPYRKFGERVMYQIAKVEAWIERQPQGGDGVEASALKPGRRRGRPRKDTRL